MGGRPYTPRSYLPQHREWVFSDNWNSERYNFYSRLDIMILRRFNFNKINIITFLIFKMFLIEIISGNMFIFPMVEKKWHINISNCQ